MSRLSEPGRRTGSATDTGVTQEEFTHALYYLAATKLMDKNERERGDVGWEKEFLSRLTVGDIPVESGALENPMRKIALMLAEGHAETVRQWAKMWEETHPQKPGEVGELK